MFYDRNINFLKPEVNVIIYVQWHLIITIMMCLPYRKLCTLIFLPTVNSTNDGLVYQESILIRTYN